MELCIFLPEESGCCSLSSVEAVRVNAPTILRESLKSPQKRGPREVDGLPSRPPPLFVGIEEKSLRKVTSRGGERNFLPLLKTSLHQPKTPSAPGIEPGNSGSLNHRPTSYADNWQVILSCRSQKKGLQKKILREKKDSYAYFLPSESTDFPEKPRLACCTLFRTFSAWVYF